MAGHKGVLHEHLQGDPAEVTIPSSRDGEESLYASPIPGAVWKQQDTVQGDYPVFPNNAIGAH